MVDTLRQYESPSAFLAALETARPEGIKRGCYSSWHARDCGGKTFDDMIANVRAGDSSLVATSEEVLASVDTSHVSDKMRARWENGVVGRVNVPAYMAGSPMCMRRRVKREAEVSTIRLYVEVGCSASVDHDNMLKRGAAVLALIQQLQACQVSVELYATMSGEATNSQLVTYSIALGTSPLDIAGIAPVIAQPAFARHLAYFMFNVQDNYRWNSIYRAEIPEVRKAHGMAPTDVYLPWVYSGELECTSPARWVAEKLSQLADSI